MQKKNNLKAVFLNISSLYKDACLKCSDEYKISADASAFEAETLRVAKLLYNQKLKGTTVDQKLLQKTAAELLKGITTGYGKTINDTHIDVTDREMLRRLEQNANVFSGFKTYQQQQEIKSLIKDDKGKVRPFNEFKNDVLAINVKYNVTYLQAEYNHVIGASRMASNWVGFYKNKADFPFLKYSTVGDNRVRDEHAALDGVLRAIDDMFWDMYYPPNGWGCRCDVHQEYKGTETNLDTITTPTLKPMFRNNVGKTGEAFAKQHPYFATSPAVKKAIEKQLAIINKDTYKSVFENKETGGYVLVADSHKKSPEYKDNLSIAKIFANKGNKVKLLGISKVPGVKSPDAMIDGIIWEFKTNNTGTITSVDTEIRNAKAQANNVLLKINSDISMDDLAGAINSRVKRSKNIGQLSVIIGKDIFVFKRKNILNGSFIEVLKKAKR